MPIPDNQMLDLEVIVYGLITAGGSDAVRTVSVFTYNRAAVVVPMSKAAFNTAFDTAIVTPMAAALNNRWSHTLTTVRVLNDAQDPVTTFTGTAVGGVAGDGLSSLSAVYTLLRTPIRGRFARGGKWFGPLSEADVTAPNDDVLNAAAIARFTTLNTALATPIVDATPNTWNLSVVQRSRSQIRKNPTTVFRNNVNAILQNIRVTELRRRKTRSVY